jgi:hypothetical protein
MKREFGGNFIKLLFFIACVYGIIRISIWSYFQTQLFFSPFDGTSGDTIISNGLSLLSQYGQNVVLFLAMIEAGRRIAYTNKINKLSGNKAHIAILEEEINKSNVASNIYYSLFAVFALIDAGTNLGEFFKVTYIQATLTITDKTSLIIFAIVGGIISVVVVFVEELFMAAVNATLHAFNDVLTSMGKKRFSSLDLFVDPDVILATRLESGDKGTSKGSSSNNSPRDTARDFPVNIPRQGSSGNQNHTAPTIRQSFRQNSRQNIPPEPTLHSMTSMTSMTEEEMEEMLANKYNLKT